jgi:alpha-mannosidase
VVFNPVAWNTTVPVTLNVPDASTGWEWVEPTGQVLPVQMVSGVAEPCAGTVLLKDLPAFGYRTGWLRPAGKPSMGPLNQARISAQGELLEVEVSSRSGNITRLVDRSTGRNWVRDGGELGRLRVDYEKPHNMSAWYLGPIANTRWLDKADSVECIEEGPVRVVFRARYQFGKSHIEKDTILYRDLGRMGFVLRVDWQERGTEATAAPLLRIEFPSPFQSAQAIYLVPFGEIQRPQDGADYCASYGMGLGAQDGSLCVFNNYKCAYSATNNVVRVTLLRSPYDPDPAPDVGQHTIPLALEITSRPWSSAGFSRHGLEFNRTPIVVASTPHAGRLPSEHSFVSVEPATAIITALKTAYDSPSNVVLRVYQADGFSTKVRISTALPLANWRETDLIERPFTNNPSINSQSLPLNGWEIKTWLLGK